MRLNLTPYSRRSLISLTPLIDVVFILLLFFMLTSRFQHYQAIPLSVPANDSTSIAQSNPESVFIELQSNGNVSINGAAPVEQAQLANTAVVNKAIIEALPVVVSTGTGVTLSTLTRLMDSLSASGLTGISLRGVR